MTKKILRSSRAGGLGYEEVRITQLDDVKNDARTVFPAICRVVSVGEVRK